MKASVLIVDDHAPWRDCLRSILKTQPEIWDIIGEASDGQEAVEQATEMQPDIILLDVGMPLMDGIQAARIIRQRSPKSIIVFVTQESDVDVRNAAMETGAAAYVLKTHTEKQLSDAMTAALCR